MNAPHIWVPRVGILEAEIASPTAQIAAEYTVTRRKADTLEVVQEVGPFKNMITDQGLNRVGTNSFSSYAFVGTGTLPGAAGDATMGALLAWSQTSQVGWNPAILRGGAPEHWVQGSGTTRFLAGVATGTITEVGVGWTTASPINQANHRVSSRALIVDGSGNPVAITTQADEVLDVTYSIRLYPYVGEDVVQTVNISGVTYTFTTRSLGVLSSPFLSVGGNTGSWPSGSQTWSSGEVFFTGTAAGTPPALAPLTDATMLNQGASGVGVTTRQPYVDNSLKQEAVFRLELNQGNLAYGLRAMLTRPCAGYSPTSTFINTCYQSTITPAIPKTNQNVLQFGASMTWSRKT